MAEFRKQVRLKMHYVGLGAIALMAGLWPQTLTYYSDAPTTTGYQFVAEQGDRVYSVDLPADTTEWTVPAEFFRGDRDRKIEILGTESSGNRTATEEEL